jgi:CRP/FNR family cyclic AMP-dependent transcriptional regulator
MTILELSRIDAELTLRQAALFRGVSPEATEALCAQFEYLHLGPSAVLLREGDPGDDLYIVLSGKVKLSRKSHLGRELLVSVLGPGEQFGELSVFDPGPRTATVIAVTHVHLARLPKRALETWIRQYPEIGLQLLHVLARRLRRTDNTVRDLIFVDVPGRLAKQLLQLAGRFGSPTGEALVVNHDLTQEELAQLVGASRETVNKALADFSQRGWIRVDGRSIAILNRERLARRAR